MAAPISAATSNESGDIAMHTRRSRKPRGGAGASGALGWSKNVPLPLASPVSNARRMMSAASSNRSRASFMSSPNCPYSIFDNPRPRPSLTLPSARMSSSATFSATRTGCNHQGRITAAVTSVMDLVRPAK